MFCRPRFLQFSLSRYQKIHIKTNSKTLLIINRECFLVRNNYALNLDLNTTRSIISITNKNNETIPRKFAFFILSLFKFERGNFLLLNIALLIELVLYLIHQLLILSLLAVVALLVLFVFVHIRLLKVLIELTLFV